VNGQIAIDIKSGILLKNKLSMRFHFYWGLTFYTVLFQFGFEQPHLFAMPMKNLRRNFTGLNPAVKSAHANS
jgi:hypothetical protein